MSRRTLEAYQACLIETSTNIINGKEVKVVITDFEKPIKESCKLVFPNAYVAGCDVHYDRVSNNKYLFF